MENIYWNYDASLNARGNAVKLTAYDFTSAERMYEGINKEEGVLYYSRVAYDAVAKNHEGDPAWTETEIIKNIPENLKIRCKTKDEQKAASDKGYVALQSTIGRITTTNPEIATDFSLIASMDDIAININNQWVEGNGSSNFFNSVVDGLADMTQSGTARSIENNYAEGLRTLGMDPNDSSLVKWARMINNQRYRTSTNFLKYYQGSNISVPVAIRRTFVTDRFDYDVADDLRLICKWCCGLELPASKIFTNSQQNGITQSDINKAYEDSKLQSELVGNVGDKFISALNRNGGVLQRAPLGYIYDPNNWTRMFSESMQNSVFEGTITVEFPNGIKFGGMLVSDCTIVMSATQVLTKFGLRPTTVNVQMQLQPARLWGATDLQRIITFNRVN